MRCRENGPAGSRLIKVVNEGQEDHQVRIEKLRDGVTAMDWMNAMGGEDTSEPVAGVARMSPGQTVYLPVDLTPGNYVLYCLIPAAASGVRHAGIGMIRAITVE